MDVVILKNSGMWYTIPEEDIQDELEGECLKSGDKIVYPSKIIQVVADLRLVEEKKE